MALPRSAEITGLLRAWSGGDESALERLSEQVYHELRRMARRYMKNERQGNTLQTTALVHEAYLRLEKQGAGQFQNREHFVAICAQLMRQILVEYARSHRAAKRDGGLKLELDDAAAFKSKSVDLVALDDALTELARMDPRQSQIIELRFFGGLSIEETAGVLDLSPATVKRDWTTARVWLRRQLSKATKE